MTALPLLLLLLQLPTGQRPPPPSTSPADSAWARAALDSALAASAEVATGPVRAGVEGRIATQLAVWAPADVAWRFAWQIDSTRIADGQLGSYLHTMRMLARVFRAGEDSLARVLLDRLPPGARDSILVDLPGFMGLPTPALVEEIEGRPDTPLAQAELLANRALRLVAHDSVGAREMLARAVAIASDAPGGAYQAYQWAHTLRRWGAAVPAGELVRLSMARSTEDAPDDARLRNARMEVAQAIRESDPDAAAALADTLLAGSAGHQLQPTHRALLLDIRSAPGDSAHAHAIRDSVQAAERARPQPRRPPPFAASPAQRRTQSLYSAIMKRDTTAFLAALDSVESPGPLSASARSARATLERRPYRRGFVLPDDERAWSELVFAQLWSAAARLPEAAGDSARVDLVGLLALRNPAAAVDSARTLRTPAARQLALAAALQELAHVEAARAEREVATLTDPAARSVVLLELTRRAVAGGRLAHAEELADAVQEPERRVEARVALAEGLLGVHAIEQARAQMRDALRHLQPLWAPDHRSVVGRYQHEGPVMSRVLIEKAAALALQLELRRELLEWARTRGTAEERAAAWVLLPEAMAMIRLGWHR